MQMSIGRREMKEKQYINYLKSFAVLLVLNSHLDSIYPNAALGFGGVRKRNLLLCKWIYMGGVAFQRKLLWELVSKQN